MSVLIARFSNKRDAKISARNAQKHRNTVKLVEDAAWEDFILGKLIEQAEKEGGVVPIEKVLTNLRTNGSHRKTRI